MQRRLKSLLNRISPANFETLIAEFEATYRMAPVGGAY
jgi:hypothetical protein